MRRIIRILPFHRNTYIWGIIFNKVRSRLRLVYESSSSRDQWCRSEMKDIRKKEIFIMTYNLSSIRAFRSIVNYYRVLSAILIAIMISHSSKFSRPHPFRSMTETQRWWQESSNNGVAALSTAAQAALYSGRQLVASRALYAFAIDREDLSGVALTTMRLNNRPWIFRIGEIAGRMDRRDSYSQIITGKGERSSRVRARVRRER